MSTFQNVFCQLTDYFIANTPNNIPPTRRTIYRQLAEQYFANSPKNAVKVVISGYNTDTTNGNEVF